MHCVTFAAQSVAHYLDPVQQQVVQVCEFYDMTTITYNKLEHAQLKQYSRA